ncbi:MAG: hypothetical protein KDA96_03880 [Planctomycetaceae bacterium]|nr:hypothetical protein [Planctomycetaceae bacterium]
MSRELRILLEDNDLVAVWKPSGMSVHAHTFGFRDGLPLLQRLHRQIGAQVQPVHRLDRATSGIVLFALNSQSASVLGQQFMEGTVQKRYLALVRGFCPSDGQLNYPLQRRKGADRHRRSRDTATRTEQTEPTVKHETNDGSGSAESGLSTPAVLQEALTCYESLRRFAIPICSDRYPTTRCCLLKVIPHTGRWHQIRRHFNRFSHPIIGDTSHGDSRQNRFFREQFGIRRLMLVSTSLQFQHPATGNLIRLDEPADPGFQTGIDRLAPHELD